MRGAQGLAQSHAIEFGGRFVEAPRFTGIDGRGAALGDGALEQTLRQGRGLKDGDRCRAGRLAEDGDAVRIAAEGRDILLHPLQRRDLVEDALVAVDLALGGQFGMREEAEDAQTIVQRHHDDAVTRHVHAVIERLLGRTAVIAAAMDPYHDRKRLALGLRRRPDVEVEAVFAFGEGDPGRRLPAGLRESRRRAHARPRHDRLRRAPAQIADRRRGIGDAEPDAHAVLACAFDQAALDVYGRGRGRRHKGQRGHDR